MRVPEVSAIGQSDAWRCATNDSTLPGVSVAGRLAQGFGPASGSREGLRDVGFETSNGDSVSVY
jgi:hypothetical protein